MGDVILKPGREKPVLQRHPWIFSGAIRSLPTDAPDGSVVEIRAHDGRWLARGFINRRSQIQVRILTWKADEIVDEDFWRRRLTRALRMREDLPLGADTTAYRLVNGESDDLPGLVVDRYGPWLVLQSGILGMEAHKRAIAHLLLERTGCQGVYERSDLPIRRQEGLASASGLLAGEEPPEQIEVKEHGYRFVVDVRGGQKTGFYTDQRPNRVRVAAYASGREVLNAFAYTGAFGVYALGAGARRVINVDANLEALELGEKNLKRNGFDPERQVESICGDVFTVLRDWRDQARRYDLIILDPPKFASSRRNLDAALRGYKDINLLAFQLLRPGGVLATFSCSGLVNAELFQKVIFGAAVDAGRQAQVLEWLRQGPDHPVALTFPEGAYLKGLICRVDD